MPGRVLDVQRGDDAVVDDHRIALRAGAEAEARAVEREADFLGEIGIAVGEELDRAGRAGRLRPGVHDEDVVGAGHHDRIDALGLDLGGLGEEAGQMVLVAGRREGAGNGEEHDLLALEQVVRRLRRRAVRGHHAKGRLRKLVTHLDGHRTCSP